MVRSLVDELRTVREPNSERILIAAAAEQVRKLVLDPLRMAELGEEIESISWLGGAETPALGAKFLGRNRNGRRQWETECTVTECAPDRLGYDVHARVGKAQLPISRWLYEVEQVDAATTRVTETNWIKAPVWFAPIGAFISGAFWRPAANRAHITTTLERVRAAFEQPDRDESTN